MNGVYLIHFEIPFKHAYHYIGYSSNIERRLEKHKKGEGSRLIKAVTEAGINWQLARVWENETRDFERKLHKQKNSRKRLCPICKGNPCD